MKVDTVHTANNQFWKFLYVCLFRLMSDNQTADNIWSNLFQFLDKLRPAALALCLQQQPWVTPRG